MSDKLTQAILNNNDLYEAVFRPHRIESYRNDLIWFCPDKTPPLYSNLVTLSANWRPDRVFEQIDTRFKAENWEEWAVKDSFAVLDLGEYGFKKLFDARWHYLEAENFKPFKSSRKLNYRLVENEKELSAWRLAWDGDERLGREIFKEQLLADPQVHFVAGWGGGKIKTGGLLNQTAGNIWGISNFFAPDESVRYWSDLIDFISPMLGSPDLVGYERPNLARSLRVLGFETIGNLRVWLKRRS